jgi:hypothetical protein
VTVLSLLDPPAPAPLWLWLPPVPAVIDVPSSVLLEEQAALMPLAKATVTNSLRMSPYRS